MDKIANPIETFRLRILLMYGATHEQVCIHEAGHRFFWKLVFPEIRTRYAVRNGLPLVERVDGNAKVKAKNLSREEASRWIYVKLGGIAAEMLTMGLEADADEIARWVASDYLDNSHCLDWGDDSAHGGDLSQAITIIVAQTNRDSLAKNLSGFLQSCISNIRGNAADFWEEVSEARKAFGNAKLVDL